MSNNFRSCRPAPGTGLRRLVLGKDAQRKSLKVIRTSQLARLRNEPQNDPIRIVPARQEPTQSDRFCRRVPCIPKREETSVAQAGGASARRIVRNRSHRGCAGALQIRLDDRYQEGQPLALNATLGPAQLEHDPPIAFCCPCKTANGGTISDKLRVLRASKRMLETRPIFLLRFRRRFSANVPQSLVPNDPSCALISRSSDKLFGRSL